MLRNRELNAKSMAVANLAPTPLLKSDYYRDTSVPSLQLQVSVSASEWTGRMAYQQEAEAVFSDVQTAQIFGAYTNELSSSYSHQFQVLAALNSALKRYWGKQLAALGQTKAEEATAVTEASGAGAAKSKAKELYSWRDVSVQIPYSHLAKEALDNADSGVEMCEALIEDVRSFYSEAELCTQYFLSFVLHGTPSELKDYQQFVIAHAQDLACVPQAWQALTQALIEHCKSGVTLSRSSFAQALAFLPENDGAVAQWEQLQKVHSFTCLTLTQCAEILQQILVFMGKVQMWINLFGLTVCNIKESYDETQNNLMTPLNAHPLNNRQHSAATEEDYREAFAHRNDKKYISTGHKYLDAIIYGYYLGGVSILAAYSGTGKTWFGIDTAVHALQQGLRVGFFSTEMSLDSMHERLLQYLLNCDYQTLHKVVPEKALHLALDLICSWSKDKSTGPHFNLYCPSSNLDRISIEMIEQEVTTAAASERGFDFIVVDYLQDVENNTCKDAEVYKRYLNSMRRLVSLCIKFKCVILLLAQMRPSDHSYSSGQPSLYEIAEGSYVVNSAQAVMFLRNCKVQSRGKGKGQEQETNDKLETYLQVVKNRAGSALSTSKLKCTRSAGSHFTFVPENSY